MAQEKHQGTFYIIPAILAEEGNLTKAMLFGLITSLTNRKGYCYASNKYLAEKFNRKDKSIISKYISELESGGWIITEIDKEAGNKRKIWLVMGYMEKTNKVYGKNLIGNGNKPKSYKEKTEDINIRENNKGVIKEKSSPKGDQRKENSDQKEKADIRTSSPEISIKSKINLSSISKEAPIERKVNVLTDPDHLKVFEVYHELFGYVRCSIKTPSILVGIPRAVKIYKEFYREEAADKLVEALKSFEKSELMTWMMDKDIRTMAPKSIFSESFVSDHLLTFNIQNKDGNNSNQHPQTDEELRKISQDNKERYQKWMERRSGKQDTEARV